MKNVFKKRYIEQKFDLVIIAQYMFTINLYLNLIKGTLARLLMSIISIMLLTCNKKLERVQN